MTSHALQGLADGQNTHDHRESTAAIAGMDLLQAATTEIKCAAEGLNTPDRY